MPLDDRDRRALLWGAPVVVALLLYLIARGAGGSSPPPPVANDLSPTIVEPAPAPIVAPPPVVVAPPVPAMPSVDVSQLRLVGILSSGALIAMADGSQRFVPVGREIVPGVTLRGVDVHQAILATPSGEVRLGLDSAPPPAAVAPSTPPTAVPQRP